MASSSYLELLKLKRAKLLKVLNLFKWGVGERSDFVNKSLCGSDYVSFNHSNEAVLKLSFTRDVKIECTNKRLIKLRNVCGKYLLCSVPDCGYKARSASLLARHKLVHYSGQKPFKCGDCKYATNQKSYLKEHRVRMHSKIMGCKKVFVCEFDGCNYRTTLNFNAVVHRRRHLNIKPFQCRHPDCVLSFVRQSTLHNHKMVHAERKRFKCMHQDCNFATKRRYSLISHQATHSGVRAFKCPHNNCSYAAKQRNSLRGHLLSHSEAKPYQCDFKHCKYAGTTKQRLRLHRAVHSEVRPFKCDYKNCSYATRQKGNLFLHKRSHESGRAGKGKN